MPVSVRLFRHVMGCFATGVTVVTVFGDDNRPVGITINSLTSVSLSPLLVLFCLDRHARVFPAFKKADYFAVNILTRRQENLSRYFAGRQEKPLPTAVWARPQNTCPLLKNTLASLVCRKTATMKGGDHVILLGEVITMKKAAKADKPLLYFQGKYGI